MKRLFAYTLSLLSLSAISAINAMAQNNFSPRVRTHIPVDSLRLSDPFILADSETQTYYMTGTSGLMWKSRDLRYWDGPYNVTDVSKVEWMGLRPMVWAAELHKYNDKYYYFATFTNSAIKIDTVQNNVIERRACHVLVSDRPDGPYLPMEDETYLPANQPTLDATFWIDTDKNPYMIFCHEWLQNLDGTVESIPLKADLSGTQGKRHLLFRASDSPWSREKGDNGTVKPNKVTDGPFVFRTDKGTLGMIWTSWVFDKYTQGVAYSQSGTLEGPWVQEKDPITPPNFGHGMIFQTFEGKWLLCCHSHYNQGGGNYLRRPCFFEIDLTGDKLKVHSQYHP